MSEYQFYTPKTFAITTPARPFRMKMQGEQKILDANGQIFHYSFVDGRIIYSPGPSVHIGDEIIHQIQNVTDVSPAPEGSGPTLEDVIQTMTNIFKSSAHKKCVGPDFVETYGHLFGKSRKELEQIIEDGAYEICSGGFYLITGKGGLIHMILNFDNYMKDAVKNFTP